MCDSNGQRSGLGCYSNLNESTNLTEQSVEVNVSSTNSEPTSSTPPAPSSTPTPAEDSSDK